MKRFSLLECVFLDMFNTQCKLDSHSKRMYSIERDAHRSFLNQFTSRSTALSTNDENVFCPIRKCFNNFIEKEETYYFGYVWGLSIEHL